MTPHPTPLPADLRTWVTNRLAGTGPVTAEDVSWPRDDSRVWRVSRGPHAAYVKICPTAQTHAREVHAYDRAVEILGPDEAPRLLAADPDLRAIMTTPVAGAVVKDLPLPPAQERLAHELAARLLARWHTADPDTIPATAREQALASVTARADAAAPHLEHAAPVLTQPQHALAERARKELPQLAPALPLAHRHGDFAPRNWLWNADRATVALFDFEQAAPGIAVEDLVWLFATTWPTRPDLKKACLTGYDRRLDQAENRALTLFTALAATSYVSAGVTLDRPDLITKGQDAFAHLLGTARTP
ncbi:aminoglycoside phosphotransferase family protein [Embleya sp. NPDC059237]|uniref:aminoglycoside phosphotransferase family protein n=1 Tax=Embleya sp. NPDC059237 TaxID=3346784 RepID=UPI00369E6C95